MIFFRNVVVNSVIYESLFPTQSTTLTRKMFEFQIRNKISKCEIKSCNYEK